jgi:hypothetical protein
MEDFQLMVYRCVNKRSAFLCGVFETKGYPFVYSCGEKRVKDSPLFLISAPGRESYDEPIQSLLLFPRSQSA